MLPKTKTKWRARVESELDDLRLLDDDWDGQGSRPPSSGAINSAADFIQEFPDSSMHRLAPTVSPFSNASVQLELEGRGDRWARVLFEDEMLPAIEYGDLGWKSKILCYGGVDPLLDIVPWLRSTRPVPKTLVMYKGGGSPGCHWEWNYAYFDKDGEFHSILATGYRGCKTEDELQPILAEKYTDLYFLDSEDEILRFGWEAPISHLMCVAREFEQEKDIEVTLSVRCDECGCAVNPAECFGVGEHGIGGIAVAFRKIVCEDCFCSGSCAYCGEWWGADALDPHTSYCPRCADDPDVR